MSQPPLKRQVRNFLPELVYGANDGVVTTLAVIAGVTGAELSATIILILGFANLFADGVSMGASSVLSERSKVDHRPTLREAAPKGLATFGGFVLAGVVPLLAYIIPVDENRFVIAAILATITLFLVGTGRALVAERYWLSAGVEMLLIGMSAAAVAYGVGVFGAMLTGTSA